MRTSAKGKLILFTFLFLVFAGFVSVKFFFLDTKNNFGELKVVSSPEASVFLDSVAMGKTPYQGKTKIGEYELKLIPQGEATNTASWKGKIKIFKNALTFVNRELGSSDLTSAGEIFWISKMEDTPSDPNNGEIYVETEPIGAIVKLDNDEKGVAPLILGNVLKGTHEISIFLPGFFPRTQKVNVESGYRVNASFKLAIDQSQKPAIPEAELKKNNEATASAETANTKIRINDTPTGFLRVRAEPSTSASEIGQVSPGDTFDLLEERSGWYKIEYEESKEGWVSGQYCEKIEQ